MMVQLRSALFASFVLASACAMPMQKRINQIISDSTQLWVQACTKAGGGQQCSPISIKAFDTLLAAGANCDQQDAADAMVDLAKTLSNDPEMIRLSQLFVQQPRNAPDKLQVPYCQKAPKNSELNGLFHCQFAGSDFTKFSGDQTGNLPLGVTVVSPPGSCPAKLDGPVPDGVQLNTLTTSPGKVGGGLAAAAAPPPPPAAVGGSKDAVAPTEKSTVAPAPPAPGAKSFTLQNGKDAQALNAQFATLTNSSSCTEGSQACVNGQFAQCVGAKFVITGCAAGTQCFALPLVNKAGTSITCSTEDDATQRIADTGATGGITGA